VRPITGYVSGTGVATVSWPWDTAPDNTTTWSIAAVASVLAADALHRSIPLARTLP
jgi:hypothetical protein